MCLFVKAGISGRYSNTTHTKHQHVTSPGGGGGASEHEDPLPHQQSGLQVRAGQHGLQRLQVIIVEMASAFPSRYRPSQPVHGGVRQRGLNTGSNHTKQQEPWPKRGSKVVGWVCLRLLGGCGRNKSVTSRHVTSPCESWAPSNGTLVSAYGNLLTTCACLQGNMATTTAHRTEYVLQAAA